MAEGTPAHISTSAPVFEDHSGISTSSFDNPYDALLTACNNDPREIQALYALHRTKRNAQQKALLLSPTFPGVTIDPILLRLTNPSIEPGYMDPRNCLVFWARPMQPVKDLILHIQKELLTVAPNLWAMPPSNLHLTTLEITHSKTAGEIASLVETLRPSMPQICDYTLAHRARLIKPTISYDASALALSFVPAAPSDTKATENSISADNHNDNENENYTYHHLRRDLYALCTRAGVRVDSRYVVPSSHLTIGRFIEPRDFDTQSKMAPLIAKIDELNAWLEREYWPSSSSSSSSSTSVAASTAASTAASSNAIKPGGEWVVGAGQGLDCRQGRLWYGGGATVYLGRGF